MAILRNKTYLDDHLQNVQARFRLKIFIIYNDCTRNERYQSFRNITQPQTIVGRFERKHEIAQVEAQLSGSGKSS